MSTDSIPKQTLDTQAATVRQYEGIVATDRGAVEAARLQLSYTKIYAPLTGQVGLRLVDPGNMVHASDSTGLVSITELDPITVVAAIPEVSVQPLLKRIHAGGDVLVEAWDAGMKSMIARGKLLSTDNQIDTATGTLKLKSEFPNTSRALFPNQFVNVRVLIGQDTDATVISQSAVQRGAQGTYVYLINPDSTVTVRVVKLGTTDGDRVAVVSGLTPGDRVVSDGADKLREGAKVEVIDRAAAQAAGEAPAEGKGGARKGRRGKGGDGGGAPAPTGAPGAGGEGNVPPGTGGQDRPAGPGGNPDGAGSGGNSGGGRNAAPSPGTGA
jgi:multidrug efflux system membrane fusion protein